MSIDEKKKLLALHRLQQAAESFEEAQYLMTGGKSLRSVANRIYYGMFYAVLALLIYYLGQNLSNVALAVSMIAMPIQYSSQMRSGK